jgi:hypothetical protein
MIGRQARVRRVRTAAETLGLGFFYIGMVTFLLYALLELLQSGVL